MLFILIAVLNISEASSAAIRDVDEVNVIFTCAASGYPYVQLLDWHITNFSSSPFTIHTFTERNDYGASLVTTLITNAENTCWESSGLSCMISNGGSYNPIIESSHISCPPG